MHLSIALRIVSRLLMFSVPALLVPFVLAAAHGDSKPIYLLGPAIGCMATALGIQMLPAMRRSRLENLRRPETSRLRPALLMIMGGGAVATTGGSKVVRLYAVLGHAALQLNRLVRARIVLPIQLGRREVAKETIEGMLGFYLRYPGVLVIGGFAMTMLGMDLVSGFTAAVSALDSIGPGLGTAGAAQNFAQAHPAGMYLLSFGMLLGRLEIYTVPVFFAPHFWRRG